MGHVNSQMLIQLAYELYNTSCTRHKGSTRDAIINTRDGIVNTKDVSYTSHTHMMVSNELKNNRRWMLSKHVHSTPSSETFK